ncbi:MAG: hypothetical protein ACTHXC_00380 [Brachybacterium sp.]
MAIPESKRQLLLDQVENVVEKRRSGVNANHSRFDLRFRHSVMPYLRAAAMKRNVSLYGYARRAVFAFVARDLGIDREEMFRLEGKVAPYGGGVADVISHEEEDMDIWEVGRQ